MHFLKGARVAFGAKPLLKASVVCLAIFTHASSIGARVCCVNCGAAGEPSSAQVEVWVGQDSDVYTLTDSKVSAIGQCADEKIGVSLFASRSNKKEIVVKVMRLPGGPGAKWTFLETQRVGIESTDVNLGCLKARMMTKAFQAGSSSGGSYTICGCSVSACGKSCCAGSCCGGGAPQYENSSC